MKFIHITNLNEFDLLRSKVDHIAVILFHLNPLQSALGKLNIALYIPFYLLYIQQQQNTNINISLCV